VVTPLVALQVAAFVPAAFVPFVVTPLVALPVAAFVPAPFPERAFDPFHLAAELFFHLLHLGAEPFFKLRPVVFELFL
jgi:hypothetical protein